MIISLDMYQTLFAAVCVLMLGRFLKARIGFLEKFCIPAPVIGGVLFAVFTCLCYVTGIAEFEFDDILKEVCMVFFFTSVGFQANLKVLKSGGKSLILFLGLVVALILCQNFLAVGLADLLGISPLIGLCTGSIPMVGGHGTAGAFGPVLEDFGVAGATTLCTAAATYGLIAGSVMGGPTGRLLIERRKLLDTVVPEDDSLLVEEEIKHERQKTNDSKNKILQNANEQAANILAEAKAFADKAIKVMNTSGVTVKELEEERSKLREKTKMRQEKSVSKAPAKKKSTDKPEDYKPGVRVLVHDMDSYGEILTPPDKKNECTVLIGNFKLKQNIRNLQIDRTPQPKEKKTETSSSYASKIRSNKSRSISPEINLLGMTVDEAIGVLDKYLDDAYLAGVAQVRIVHGKGTGALKKGISQYLSGLPYVSNFRLGIHGEGEDGVTIVTF